MSQVTASDDGLPDKDAICALYLKGWTPAEIAERFNVNVRRVHKWVVRYGWSKLKTKERENDNPQEGDVKRVERLRNGITEEQERDLAVIRSKQPRNLKDAREREELLNLMAKSLDTLHPQATQTNIAVSVSLLSTAQVVRPETPAIDVSSVVQDVGSTAQGQPDTTPDSTVRDVPGAVTER